MTIRTVTLIGANGTLGPSVLAALLAAKTFTVTVLSRASSKSKYGADVTDKRLSDDFPTHELQDALRGQDAVVVTTAGTNDDLQIRIADAAVAAGVRRFVPADFGSCDSGSARALDLVPLYGAKKKVREHLERLAGENEGFSWTSLVCGHFFDHGLQTELLHFDVLGRKVRVFDGGDVKASFTTLETIGFATVRVLQRERETEGKMLYIQSFCVSQNEVLEVVKKVKGGEWKVENVDAEEYMREQKKRLAEGDKEATERLVGALGVVDADWRGKEGFAMELLGLEDEDLEDVVRKAIGK
ncbi:hypothetical protein LTS18_005197 [Coniosporium uncinatum]|uniref:Uncharacterized protein n=1 Tax=Coniosporium uncinatum TaxID=93489 RepID=A0ACC3D577_9PEZI|nr:hypothetical protein LTS18_005197 [Coniosporium uncinatum]